MSTLNINQDVRENPGNEKAIVQKNKQNSLQEFVKAGKDLGLSGQTDLASFETKLNEQLGLVKSQFDASLADFETKMEAERSKISGLITTLENKQSEALKKTQELTSQLPLLRKVYEMSEIEERQRRRIQNSYIDGEIDIIEEMYESISEQLKALRNTQTHQTFLNAKEVFSDDTQKFALELISIREQIMAFQKGFAMGKGIYDDIQAMNQPPAPPPPPASGDAPQEDTEEVSALV